MAEAEFAQKIDTIVNHSWITVGLSIGELNMHFAQRHVNIGQLHIYTNVESTLLPPHEKKETTPNEVLYSTIYCFLSLIQCPS